MLCWFKVYSNLFLLFFLSSILWVCRQFSHCRWVKHCSLLKLETQNKTTNIVVIRFCHSYPSSEQTLPNMVSVFVLSSSLTKKLRGLRVQRRLFDQIPLHTDASGCETLNKTSIAGLSQNFKIPLLFVNARTFLPVLPLFLPPATLDPPFSATTSAERWVPVRGPRGRDA